MGTPGRILDFLKRDQLNLSDLKVFTLDEADEMFSIGFIEDVKAIMEYISSKAQGLFVSATVSSRVLGLAEQYLENPAHIAASNHDEKPPEIEHLYCEVGEQLLDKPIALCDLLDSIGAESAIIFCNTKSETELIEEFMRRRGFDARRINSDLNQTQRNKVMDRIRKGNLKYLVATDIAARGIDIAELELVVNYSAHTQVESYVHRTGRTGRAGKKGTALTLVGPQDFLAFNAIKGLDLELKKVDVPSDVEVARAQLTHLKKNLRDTAIKLTPRDLSLIHI